MRKANEIKGKKILTSDFYRQLKIELEELSDDPKLGKLFSRLGKKGEIIKGKKDKDGNNQFYFINIDKLKKLSIHDLKFIIDLILTIANQELQDEDIVGVNFCSLEFTKTKPTKRGVTMLEKQKERGKISKISKPKEKMNIKIKKRDLIIVK